MTQTKPEYTALAFHYYGDCFKPDSGEQTDLENGTIVDEEMNRVAQCHNPFHFAETEDNGHYETGIDIQNYHARLFAAAATAFINAAEICKRDPLEMADGLRSGTWIANRCGSKVAPNASVLKVPKP